MTRTHYQVIKSTRTTGGAFSVSRDVWTVYRDGIIYCQTFNSKSAAYRFVKRCKGMIQ